MRFLFCKNRCPSICFCHPSTHIYTPPQPSPSPSCSPSPFQLDGGKPSSISSQLSDRGSVNEPADPSLPASKEADQIPKRLEPQQTLESDQKNNAHVNGSTVSSIGEDNLQQHQELESSNDNVSSNGNATATVLKGSLRRTCSDSVLAQKKKVQWLDHVGKELTEIREFEYSEDLDYGSMNRRGCECTIL